ncbi:MAG TPA: carboxypeptidase-like regulatory domain-containing protein [candidate division Zixibacteria bacterium]|nr:carboxypeptidase-like regulatory domain-containing protein [candidate division Zixibacteria bacterium]
MKFIKGENGFTLIELVMVIVIVGIITSVAVINMTKSIDTTKAEATKAELDELGFAIVGNSSLMSNGARTDFGYVGDVGSLPPNLDALAQNPGSYSTWKGPYVDRSNNTTDEYKKDGWGVDYTFADTLIRSTGSGSNIDKIYVPNSASLFSNTITGYVIDASHSMPGTIYDDSLSLRLNYPNGAGGLTTSSTNPDARGNFTFNNVPIGNHTLTAIYIPDSDTMRYNITVTPSSVVKLDIIFPHDLW